ncbi:hypothetical protein RhiLY_08448 [Ceratobasidium sp. AG-Ba]|nr:hypothetical protein RhiLY_08448 [Ceratobasidium sp. AG-Ba]
MGCRSSKVFREKDDEKRANEVGPSNNKSPSNKRITNKGGVGGVADPNPTNYTTMNLVQMTVLDDANSCDHTRHHDTTHNGDTTAGTTYGGDTRGGGSGGDYSTSGGDNTYSSGGGYSGGADYSSGGGGGDTSASYSTSY